MTLMWHSCVAMSVHASDLMASWVASFDTLTFPDAQSGCMNAVDKVEIPHSLLNKVSNYKSHFLMSAAWQLMWDNWLTAYISI